MKEKEKELYLGGKWKITVKNVLVTV